MGEQGAAVQPGADLKIEIMSTVNDSKCKQTRASNKGSQRFSRGPLRECENVKSSRTRDDRIYSDSIRIQIFFLESRIFGFENFGDRIIFEYSNLIPQISNI